MLRGMSAHQFAEWRAYADLEPFDEERADLRAATIVQALVNTQRKKGRPPIPLEDCVLHFGVRDEKPKSAELAREQSLKTMDILMMLYGAPSPEKKP